MMAVEVTESEYHTTIWLEDADGYVARIGMSKGGSRDFWLTTEPGQDGLRLKPEQFAELMPYFQRWLEANRKS